MRASLTRGVERRVLDNGLTVLVRSLDASPVVAIDTWVKAGYFHEPDEKAGMAHLFEHMFFKGSEKFPGAERIGREVKSLGGLLNAGTIYDCTNYYFVLPREAFERGVAIQADAVIHPIFDPEELVKEAEVVIEESNRKYDNPPAYATEMMFALAFTRHRMRRWRIGSNDVLRNIRRDDLLDFFHSLYRPENMIVTVVGDVEVERAFAIVEREYSPLPRGKLEIERGPAEPAQEEFRFGERRAELSQSRVVAGWHTPGYGHADNEPLEVLSAILGAGKSCRLYRHAVGPDRAGGVYAYDYPVDDVGMFIVHAQFEGARLERVEEAVFREVERIRRDPPDPAELQIARAQILSSFLLGQEDVLGQSQLLASREARGGFEEIDRYLARLRSVTPEDVRRVAREYLRVDNLTVYRYLDRSAPAGDGDPAAVRGSLQALASDPGPAPEPDGPIEGLVRRDLEGPRPEAPRATHTWELANGVTLLVLESHAVPTAWFGAYFRGGRCEEEPSNAGITRMTISGALRGTARRDAAGMDRAIESLGSGFGAEIDDDHFALTGSAPVESLAACLGLLHEVLTEPTFPADGVEKAREVVRTGILAARDSSTAHPFDLFARAYYGEDHPYGLPQRGDLDVVGRLTADDLRAWHRKTFDAGRLLLCVAGDVDPEAVRSFAEQRFGSLPARSAPPPPVAPRPAPDGIPEVVEERPRRQSAFVIGFPTVPLDHPDYFALEVLQHVASGMGGRFFAELRGKQSLAYTVAAGAVSRPSEGFFYGYLAGEHTKEIRAREAMLEEFRRLCEELVSEEELHRAQGYIAGATKIRLQTNGRRGSELARDVVYGLGLDYLDRYLAGVAAVTAEDVRRAAAEYFVPGRHAVGVLRGGDGQ